MASAIYDVIVSVLRGRSPRADQRRRAFAEPVARWNRVLGFDGCAVQFDRALQRAGLAAEAPAPLRSLLREATNESLRRAVLVHAQLAEVAALSAGAGIRVMALKGAARLLGGELAGTRSIADIDLLAAPADAERLHALLQRELGYSIDGERYPHHLEGLTRRRSLGIEVHVRLAPAPLPLDRAIWEETRTVSLAGHAIELPSPTKLLLHTLEHAVGVNWTARYRLRDILDVAGLLAAGVDRDLVAAHVAASDCGRAMRTILAAARELQPAPAAAADAQAAWRTVRRVGRARLTLASFPRTPVVAERWFRWVGVAAEGSPRTIGRLGLDLARRVATRATAAIALLLGAAACDPGPAPRPFTVSPFVFASNAGGSWALYRSIGEQVVRLSDSGSDDREPNAAGHVLVFTSLRDGDAEIYSATLKDDLSLGAQTRLTNEYGNDAEPALDPSAATIAFVSGRSGSPRIWLMGVDGSNPRALATGSADYIPESSPRWSPSGDRIVFTSTRSGTSQVYVVPAAGGSAVQLSHETRGAFTPSWLPDGKRVLYTALAGPGAVMSVPAAGGDASVFATDPAGIGEAVCTATFCLAVASPLGGAGHVVALTAKGQPTALVLPPVADDHRPAPLTH